VGRARAIKQRRDGSQTGSVQKEICQGNGKVYSAFGQTVSTKERDHTLFGHFDDDLLCKPGWQKAFGAAKEHDQEGERRVPKVGWAEEVVRSFG
jgi:hypothetical protein